VSRRRTDWKIAVERGEEEETEQLINVLATPGGRTL